MTYRAFQDLVERLWEEIPEDFKRGLQGVHVFPEARPEPGLEGVWRLGEHLDPGPPSAFWAGVFTPYAFPMRDGPPDRPPCQKPGQKGIRARCTLPRPPVYPTSPRPTSPACSVG